MTNKSIDTQKVFEKMPISQLRQYRSAAQYDSGDTKPNHKLRCRFCLKEPVYCFCEGAIFDPMTVSEFFRLQRQVKE